jgi:hypothetical protein
LVVTRIIFCFSLRSIPQEASSKSFAGLVFFF